MTAPPSSIVSFGEVIAILQSLMPAAASKRLRDLPRLAQSRFRILIFLPGDRVHCVACLTNCHDDTILIARRGEVVVCLVTERNLSQ